VRKDEENQSNQETEKKWEVDETVDRPSAQAFFKNSSKKNDVQNKYFQKGKNLFGEDNLPDLFCEVRDLFMNGERGVTYRTLEPKGSCNSNSSQKKNERDNRDQVVKSDGSAVTFHAD
jgi:hypothetical protein